MDKKLIELWQQMSDLTAPRCGERCRNLSPTRCCSPEYCDLAESIAREEGVELEPTGHPKLKFMGKNGCVVPPHLRPLCTLHDCQICSLGFDPKDPEFTKRYFALRDKITDWS